MTPIDWSADAELPFASVFDGHVQRSLARIPIPPGWESSALDDMARDLRTQLSEFARVALHELFRTAHPTKTPIKERTGSSNTTYRQFVSSLVANDLREVDSSFPVLTELLELCCTQWVETTNETINHINSARGELKRHFGIEPDDPIVAANTGLGDRHSGGRTVGHFVTKSGSPFIYKPRSLRSEQTFFDLWRDFRLIVDDLAPVPTLVDLGTFGLVEYVQSAPVRDASSYWRRAGEMAGLLHLCVAGDLHAGNLISSGSQAVPIDLECLDQPAIDAVGLEREDLVTYSVLATGLFPHRFNDHWGGPVDLAGLFDGIPERSVRARKFWQHLGTDDIGQALSPYRRARRDNVAVDPAGDPIPCDLPALLHGLESAWEHGPSLAEAVEDWGPVRILRCGTKMYEQARTSMMQLDALQDRDLFIARSRALPRVEGADDVTSEIIIGLEAQALQHLDIPIHRAHGYAFLPDRGTPILDFYARSGSDRVKERIERTRTSGKLVDRALVTLAVEQFDGIRLEEPHWTQPDWRKVTASDDTVAQAAAGALRIANQLLEMRVRTTEGDAWLEVVHGTPMRGVTEGTGLYAGTGGIALFFAALAATTGDDQWRDACRSALAVEPVPLHEQARPWYESGWAGRVYARAACGRLLQDAELIEQAGRVFDEGLPKPPEQEDGLDILSGWSGVLLGLLGTNEMGVGTVEPARELTTWIIDQVGRRLDDPLRERSVRKMGFAHGITGLAYALAHAGVQLGCEDASQLARDLGADEEARIASRGGKPGALQGLGAEKTSKLSWCWGVTGYAMARSHPSWIEVAGSSSHLESAAAILAQAPRRQSHACCGEAGHLMAMSELNNRDPNLNLEAPVESLLASLTHGALIDGPWFFYPETSITTPGLFWGIAGIGYSLLHASNPQLAPNFLMAEPVRPL